MIARSFRLLGRWAATLGALAYTGAARSANSAELAANR